MAKLGVATGPNTFTLDQFSCRSDVSGKHRKSKKKISEQKKSQSLEEPVAGSYNEHKPTLTRSKTYDPSFGKETEEEATSVQHRNSVPNISNLMKHAVDFHRVFQDLSEEEQLLETFSCAWQREVPYHGRLYISHNHVCFYCSMLRREVKVVIPVLSISVLKKANTALLVPNAICIRTAEGEKFLFGSLRSRESTYQLLRSVCKHLQDGIRNISSTSPYISSDQLLKISLLSKELDSNHTLPEYENLPEQPDEVDGSQEFSEAPFEHPQMSTSRGRECTTKSRRRWGIPLCPLSTVILIYLFLVVVLLLSSGYIGLRIIQLEEELTSMGAWPELDLQPGYKAT